jgi:hypothetical protein
MLVMGSGLVLTKSMSVQEVFTRIKEYILRTFLGFISFFWNGPHLDI